MGISQEDPTISGLLRNMGYATGQFGKNHVGDRNETLPTVNGFDEFFGNLYHLNAEEEPELPDYPKDPAYRAKFGPRGVLETKATVEDDATADPRFGKIGKQTIEDTGPLSKKRMETVDDETSDRAIAFIKEQQAAGKPWFVWWNGTRMHFRTHVKPELRGISGQDEYADGMVEHDRHIGKFLKLLDDLGIAENTIVFYSTDNGPHMNTWPDAGWNPFRGEKNTNWEGGWRVPAMVRWPGHIEPGQWTNEIVHHMDWFPTLLAAAGDPNVTAELKAGVHNDAMNRDYKVHLDGYNVLPLLTGEIAKSPRKEVFYFSDDGDLTALRYGDWKVMFMEQPVAGTFRVWQQPFVPMRVPFVYNLRRDPYERATITSNSYYEWLLDRAYLLVPAQAYVAKFLETFQEFPPRQKAASFSLDKVMEKLSPPGG
nr:sulfatase-like hydrolase/transferase [Thiocapsa sp.]